MIARTVFRLMARRITSTTARELAKKPILSIQIAFPRIWSISPAFRIHISPPASSSAHCQQKNFTASAEEVMPAGTPCFRMENTCMGCPPVAAGVMEE